MTMKNIKSITGIIIAAAFFSGCVNNNCGKLSPLEAGFKTPPDSAKPGIYWYWINEHVSREGITADLEALHRIGIGEAFIGNIYEERMPRGDVRTLSPEWEDCMRFALTEGERIGVKVSAFNCPGWSQAGGPWITPDEAMRYLTFSAREIDGGTTVKICLPKPVAVFFQDVVTLAYPLAADEQPQRPTATAVPAARNIDCLFDGDDNTFAVFSNRKHEPVTLTLRYPSPTLKRSLLVTPADQTFRTNCEVYIKTGDKFELLKSVYFDRLSDNLSYGPQPFAPLAVALGEVTASEFRIVLNNVPERFRLGEVQLTAEAKIEHYAEKLNNKMPYMATPDWSSYQWTTQTEPSPEAVVDETRIINVSEFLNGDTLTWKAPDGRWRIMRTGMAPTLKTNKPAAPDGTGLEIDKMSRKALQRHYDAYIGKIVKGLPDSGRKSFHRVIADSYETGPGSWTDDFREVFQATYNYDPLPWLTLFSGAVVGSADRSDRFMWDLRRLVADRIASEFVGGMAEVCRNNGSELWLENYGWDGFPSEFLKYAKYSPAVGGEYWTTSPNVESRLAASACHIYDKNTVYAESYTTGGHLYEFHPGKLKTIGDQAYTEGINQHIMHLAIHQPYSDKYPGINSWFGIELHRQNTWFEQATSWIDYQRRCCYLLQQGKPAADVCFFIGEDCPKMAGWKDPTLSSGYDYDFINADVIINDLSVRNGQLVLPSGVSYSLLALPPLATMRPELIERIEELVNQGANILGAPVNRSPSLQDYPRCDLKVRETALRLWGVDDPNTTDVIKRRVGKGNVFCNVPINTALAELGTTEAVVIDKRQPVLWKQRNLPDGGRIYFLSNQSDSEALFDATFRTEGFTPELWDAVNGGTRPLPEYSTSAGNTTVSLRLDAGESCFVVFRQTIKNLPANRKNYPVETTVAVIPDNWNIEFYNKWSGERHLLVNHPLFDWSRHSADSIRYFSGTATYSAEFTLPETSNDGDLYLCLDSVNIIATVIINGREAANNIWTRPYRVNITNLLHSGNNKLEIRVTNLWRNKIVDKIKGVTPENPVYMLEFPSNYGDKLAPSGILGKVTIVKLS
jgi:hypothetical protein